LFCPYLLCHPFLHQKHPHHHLIVYSNPTLPTGRDNPSYWLPSFFIAYVFIVLYQKKKSLSLEDRNILFVPFYVRSRLCARYSLAQGLLKRLPILSHVDSVCDMGKNMYFRSDLFPDQINLTMYSINAILITQRIVILILMPSAICT
jgi:hypothetical protein